METNQNSINLKTDRIFSSLKRVARIVLTTSSILLLISIISLLVYKGESFSVNSNAGIIIWPAVVASIYSIAYSLLTIITFLIYKAFKRHLIWLTIKTEILFFNSDRLFMAIFYFVNAYIIKNY